jgi:putative sterol carrier protein
MSGSFAFLKELSTKINKDDAKKKSLLQFSGKAFQFDLNEGESFYVKFESDGSMSVENGKINSPAASVSVSDSLLIDLINGKADPVKFIDRRNWVKYNEQLVVKKSYFLFKC